MSGFYINKLLHGYSYLDIPEEYQNDEFYHTAVKAGVNPYVFPRQYSLFLEAVKMGLPPKAVPDRFRDATMCKTYVQISASPDLSVFKQSVLNSLELWTELIKMNNKIVSQVPKSQVTQELVDFAVTQDGSLLGSFQKKHRLIGTCLTAIQSPGWSDSCIADIPPENRDKEVCKAFMEKAKDICLAIDYIPTVLRTEQCLKFYARRDGNIILKFPKRLWSDQVWEMGVASFTEGQFKWSNDFISNCPQGIKAPITRLIDEDILEKERIEVQRLRVIEEEKKRTIEREMRCTAIKTFLLISSDTKEILSLTSIIFPQAGPELKKQDFEDPITMDTLQKGELYAFFTENGKIFFAGSLSMFQTFIRMGHNGSTPEKVLVPLLNKLTPTSELEWLIW